MSFNDVMKHLLSNGTVPIHVVFLNDAVCVNTLNQVFGIFGFLSALLTQVKSGLQMEVWFKPSSPSSKLLPRDDIKHFLRPYWNILPLTINVMKKTTSFKPKSPVLNFFLKRQHGSNQVVYFSIFSTKAWLLNKGFSINASQVTRQVVQNKNIMWVSSR